MKSERWGETVLSGLGGDLKGLPAPGGRGFKIFHTFWWGGTTGFSPLGVGEVPPSLARNRLPPPKVHTPLPPSSLNNFHVITQ